jgi:hypothetical protein
MNPIENLAFAVALVAASAAHADCNVAIAAYDKADASKRYAIYEVDNSAEAPQGDPFTVVIGDVEYEQQYVRKGPLEIVKDRYRKGGHAAGFQGNSLKGHEKKGEVRCEPLGERKIGGEPAIGYRIRNNDKGNQPDLAATDMWVSRTTGLPIFHSLGSDGGGLRWVFGAAVVAPAPEKVRP